MIIKNFVMSKPELSNQEKNLDPKDSGGGRGQGQYLWPPPWQKREDFYVSFLIFIWLYKMYTNGFFLPLVLKHIAATALGTVIGNKGSLEMKVP